MEKEIEKLQKKELIKLIQQQEKELQAALLDSASLKSEVRTLRQEADQLHRISTDKNAMLDDVQRAVETAVAIMHPGHEVAPEISLNGRELQLAGETEGLRLLRHIYQLAAA